MMLAVVPARRSVLMGLAALLVTMTFAGCLGGDDDVKLDGDAAVHPGCENAAFVTIAPGGPLTMENTTVYQPYVLCITNQDNETRTFVAMPNKPPKPDFVPLPSVVDPHAAHRGGAAPVLGPVSIDAGTTVIVEDVGWHGTIMFMEATNMDNSLVWEIVPAGAVAYPVVENQVLLSGSGSGDTDAGAVGTHTFEVTVPDLSKITLTLTWDDTADDGDAGQAANAADTLELRLKDPSGAEVAKKQLQKRVGELKLDHELTLVAFPDQVTSQGMTNATAQLATERPPDTSAAGTWTVEVAVLAAPGLAPDEDGSTKSLPVGDGHQAWSLEVMTIHKWASVGFAEGESKPDIVQADL